MRLKHQNASQPPHPIDIRQPPVSQSRNHLRKNLPRRSTPRQLARASFDTRCHEHHFLIFSRTAARAHNFLRLGAQEKGHRASSRAPYTRIRLARATGQAEPFIPELLKEI